MVNEEESYSASSDGEYNRACFWVAFEMKEKEGTLEDSTSNCEGASVIY